MLIPYLNDVTTSRSHEEHLRLFCTRPIANKLNGTLHAENILHVTMTLVLLGHMRNIHGLVFTFISSITIKFGRMVGQHASLYLAYDDDVSVLRSRG